MSLNMVSADDARTAGTGLTRVGYVEGAIGGPDRIGSIAALFPQVQFVSVGSSWPSRPLNGLGAMIVGVDASEVEAAFRRLGARGSGPPVIVVLKDNDVRTSRRLMQAGAADILLAPVAEAALALSLERVLTSVESMAARAPTGKVITLMKAGGGVGATAIGTQLAALIAKQEGGVCFADLDVQFGQGAMLLDMTEAMTLTDILEGGGPLEETPLGQALALHRSGTRLLAAPRDLLPLESVSPRQVESLLTALRRDFAITILDLPTVWTAWTNRALHLSDQIVLLTNLSVPHANLVKTQLRMLEAQRLDSIPLTLVCNRVSGDQRAVVSRKAAEKSIGRAFDYEIPEDRQMMNEVIAQGCELSSVRTGTRIERAIAELAGSIVPISVAPEAKRRWWQ